MDVKLWHDKCEGEIYVFFVELYAIMEATEELEKAYARNIDIFSSSEYATECPKLISQFGTSAYTLKGAIPGIHCFPYTSKMDFPYAINHQVTYGVLAIVESRASAASSAFTSAAVVPLDFKGKADDAEWVSRSSDMEATDELGSSMT